MHVYNLGTGIGTTVGELVEVVSRVSGSNLRVAYGAPRQGDPPVLVAASAKAERELGWVPRQSGIDQIVETALSWYRRRSLQRTTIATIGGLPAAPHGGNDLV